MPGGCRNGLGRQFRVSAIGAAETSLRCSAGGAHLAPERDRPDLTVCGLAHESDRLHCVPGKQELVELTLREAVSNAIHGSFSFLAYARRQAWSLF
jgi:hypothetical protein